LRIENGQVKLLNSQFSILNFVLFVIIALAAINPILLRIPFDDLAAMGSAYERTPDGPWWPDYPAFLRDVNAVTKPGDSIAIAVPATRWEFGYSYAYYRASYFLAGREVLPLFTADDAILPENLNRAKYVAVWNARVPGKWRIVGSGHHGVLLVH
jgi:hypothetical protein